MPRLPTASYGRSKSVGIPGWPWSGVLMESKMKLSFEELFQIFIFQIFVSRTLKRMIEIFVLFQKGGMQDIKKIFTPPPFSSDFRSLYNTS